MPITDWPYEDRPREKLMQKGEQTLTDAELMAIFLKSGTRGKTALDIARELLHDYGGLKTLMRAPAHELITRPGIGFAKYASLKAAIELGKRFMSETVPVGTVLNNSPLTRRFLADRLQHHPNEVFACLFMDNHFRLISFEELFHGTVNEAHIYPREIVRRGIALNAVKLIIAHNHPSGRSHPSQSDLEVTNLVQQSLGLVDIELVDHIIIGNEGHYSFADNGLI